MSEQNGYYIHRSRRVSVGCVFSGSDVGRLQKRRDRRFALCSAPSMSAGIVQLPFAPPTFFLVMFSSLVYSLIVLLSAAFHVQIRFDHLLRLAHARIPGRTPILHVSAYLTLSGLR